MVDGVHAKSRRSAKAGSTAASWCWSRRSFDYLDGDASILEVDALERLAADRQLAAYRHEGFWQCMDTLRDKRLLERLWQTGEAPWRVPVAPVSL